MVALFVFGEHLPTRLVSFMVALIAAALTLLVGYEARFEPTDDVLRDVDWKTLLFLGCIFCLVQAVTKTGLLQVMAMKLHESFGTQLTLVALVMIAAIGLLSSLLANVPVAAASILMIKGYPGGGGGSARRSAWLAFHPVARSHDSGVRRHDVRRNARSQRNPHRRIGQHRVRRHLRAPRQAGHLRHVHALWTADHRGPAHRVGDLRHRAIAMDALTAQRGYPNTQAGVGTTR
ncbi:SLC13 family permease [Cupriavidus sp. CV2]|nr:SLC13 family permease [Cupriavidus sp. CV2]MDW3684314.1 SLC13 family permease [Cupriavidus sp. CV2]